MKKEPWIYRRCTCIRVLDGDTFVAAVDLGFDLALKREVRLRHINCCEMRASNPVEKESAIQARRYTETMLMDSAFTIVSFGWDKYRRIEAEVVLSDGRNLGEELVAAGLAKPAMRLTNDT